MKSFFVFTLICLFSCYSIYSQTATEDAIKVYKKGEVNEAKLQFEKILEQDPNNYQAIYYLSEIAFGKMEYKKAADLMKLMVDKYPNNEEYHFKYGGALGLYVRDHKSKALFYLDDIKEHMHKAVEINTQYTDAYLGLIKLYVELPGFLGGSVQKAKKFADTINTYDMEAAKKAYNLIAMAD